MRRAHCLALLTVLLLAVPGLLASSKDKSGDKVASLVDSGSFGVFQGGQRVATETFHIQQKSDESITSSEIKVEDSNNAVSQSSELELSPNGDLLRYLWKELKPEKSESSLVVGDQIITQHLQYAENDKANEKNRPKDIPFLLPPSTTVLDDYFFIHRELLLWKFLATECPNGLSNCNLSNKGTFAVIVPRQHTSASVTLQYKGVEKATRNGQEEQVTSFTMHTEDSDWILYLNQDQKLVRISIPGAKIEVVRE